MSVQGRGRGGGRGRPPKPTPMIVEYDAEVGDDIYIECRRSIVDVKQILTQWRCFRRNESFTGFFSNFAFCEEISNLEYSI